MLDRLLGFIGLPSPAVLLAVLIAIGGAFAGGYHLGDGAGFNRAESARAAAQDRAIAVLDEQIKAARERSMASEQAAREAAGREARAKASLEIALKGISNAPLVPVSCLPDAFRLRVNTAIATINDYLTGTGDPGGMPGAMPTDTGSLRLKPQ